MTATLQLLIQWNAPILIFCRLIRLCQIFWKNNYSTLALSKKTQIMIFACDSLHCDLQTYIRKWSSFRCVQQQQLIDTLKRKTLESGILLRSIFVFLFCTKFFFVKSACPLCWRILTWKQSDWIVLDDRLTAQWLLHRHRTTIIK